MSESTFTARHLKGVVRHNTLGPWAILNLASVLQVSRSFGVGRIPESGSPRWDFVLKMFSIRLHMLPAT